VYESLLEFHPLLTPPWNTPTFDLLLEGRERRSTGSHYTPPELVAPLIQHALEPVLEERIRTATTREQKERAILSLKVCNIACRSGHFLLAAARRLGKELSRVRTGEDEPAPERLCEAVREVISHCIYGVDKNPLAVELCRVALWLESYAEGKPLTFLDHRIRCGGSLIGVFDLEVSEHGIPDDAFKPVAGDNKIAAREAKKRNASERDAPLFHAPFAEQLEQIAERLHALDALPEDTIEQLHAKAEAHLRIERSPECERLRLACDVWTTAFFQPYPNVAGGPLTTESLRTALVTGRLPDVRRAGFVFQAANERRFCPWPLAFPEVFAAGGFDVILGNPPFLGGLKISSEFGDTYRRFVKYAFDPLSGKADLCALFFRRAFSALRVRAILGMIATNTISQGDTRESGLAVVRARGGQITLAQRFVKWPGQANVEVNLLAISRAFTGMTAQLDGFMCLEISSRLDTEPEAEPKSLSANTGICFQGSIVLGIGFVLQSDEAEQLIRVDRRNADCLWRYITGDDLNSDPEQRASRYVIQFDERPEAEARRYRELWRIVEQRVLPERQAKDAKKYPRMVNEWWKHWNNRQELYQRVRPLTCVLARSRVSELHALAFLATDLVYSDGTVVFRLRRLLSLRSVAIQHP
jgi:hypothetical protein